MEGAIAVILLAVSWAWDALHSVLLANVLLLLLLLSVGARRDRHAQLLEAVFRRLAIREWRQSLKDRNTLAEHEETGDELGEDDSEDENLKHAAELLKSTHTATRRAWSRAQALGSTKAK